MNKGLESLQVYGKPDSSMSMASGHVSPSGSGVIVAHAVVLHGCTIADHVLLGIGCRVLDGAEVGEGSVVAAGAVVRQGMKVPPRSLVAGVPAAVKREVSEGEYHEIIDNPNRYLKYVESYTDSDMPYLQTPDD